MKYTDLWVALATVGGSMKGNKPMTAPERMREVRAAKESEGQKQVNIWLTPAAQLAMEATKSRLEARGIRKTQSEIVCDALIGDTY